MAPSKRKIKRITKRAGLRLKKYKRPTGKQRKLPKPVKTSRPRAIKGSGNPGKKKVVKVRWRRRTDKLAG